MAAGPAFGGVYDKTLYKRSVLSLAFMLTAFTYISLSLFGTFWELTVVFAIQSAVSGAYIPGINALGLGLVGSMEFSKRLIREAGVAVSPGLGFGQTGEGHVRFALVENKHRIRQAVRGIRRFMRESKP